jgi:ankyrin repeat protein
MREVLRALGSQGIMKAHHWLLACAATVLAFGLFACEGMTAKSRIDEAFEDPRAAELAKAVVGGDLERIETLVGEGVSVDSVDRKDTSLLEYAVNWDRKASFARLLELGADPNLLSASNHTTILHWVAVNYDSEWLRMAIEAGADPNIANKSGRTPLFPAMAAKNPNNLELLLDAGADINHQDVAGQTPAVFAAGVLDYESVLYLLKRGACPDIPDQFGKNLRATTIEREPADPGKEATRQQVLQLLAEIPVSSC